MVDRSLTARDRAEVTAARELLPAPEVDLGDILALLQAVDIADLGETDWTADALTASWAMPGVDPARDTVVAVEDGVVVAYGIADRRSDRSIDIDHYVAPGHERGAGVAVLDAVSAVADRQFSDRGVPLTGDAAGEVHLGQGSGGPFTAVLAERGWSPVRTFRRLTRPLAAADATPPTLPAGITVRPLASGVGGQPAEHDLRSWHAVYTSAFSEHFGSQARTYEEWSARVSAHAVPDFSVWWLARADGRDVGVLETELPGGAGSDDPPPVVNILGVLSDARGRGVGTVLLLTAFAELAHRGHRRVELGVDTANVTNAVALYEGIGMTTAWSADIWRRPAGPPPPAPLPAGD